jgi:hypothetical protein
MLGTAAQQSIKQIEGQLAAQADRKATLQPASGTLPAAARPSAPKPTD